MRNRSLLLTVSALAAFALVAPAAQAAHLSCSNSSNLPNSDLVAFDLSVQVSTNSSGSGAGAGKEVTSLTVTLPANASLVPLSQFVAQGRHSSTCTLTEPSTSGLELVLHDVIFPKLEVLNGPNSITRKTETVVLLSLAFQSMTTSQAQ